MVKSNKKSIKYNKDDIIDWNFLKTAIERRLPLDENANIRDNFEIRIIVKDNEETNPSNE